MTLHFVGGKTSDKLSVIKETKMWKITGIGLKPLHIKVDSFDEAIAEARKVNEKYCGGQVVEE